MTDLETAAAESLASVQALDAKIVTTNDRLRHMRGSVEAIDQQCDTTWKRFVDQVETFQADLKQQTATVNELGQEARHALAEARARVEADAPLVAQALDTAGDGADVLREHVQRAETQVMPLVDELETAVREVVEGAQKAKAELEKAVAEARQFMEEEVADALRQMQEAVRQRAADWRKTVQDEHREPVQADEIDWSTRLEEVMGSVEESFTGANTHATEVASFVVQELKQAVEDAISQLNALTEPLTKELQELKGQADARRGEAGSAADTLEQDVQDTIAVANDASSKLLEIAVQLAKFYFTGL